MKTNKTMSDSQIMIKKIIDNEFCIGCGNCAFAEPSTFEIKENEVGVLAARILDDREVTVDVDKLCPFSNSSLDEDHFNSEYKEESLNHDPGVGFYRNIYGGYVLDETERLESSSGGIATYLVKKLLELKKVTGAALVVNDSLKDARVKYEIFRSSENIKKSKKSKYHMVSHEFVLNEIRNSAEDETFVYVGIPCGVKSVKILMDKYPDLKRKIKYTISIFCGHQKSHAFAEYVGWQMGVDPDSLTSIDYRVKEASDDASKYFYQVTNRNAELYTRRVDQLRWMDWGLGLFKPKACDFCDDVAGESADVILGDAWHKKYAKDYRGSNIIVVRKKEIEDILLLGFLNDDIFLNKENVNFVYETQGGNFRHRHEGIVSRVKILEEKKEFIPLQKSNRFNRRKEDIARRKIYELRFDISRKSHIDFLNSKNNDNLNEFFFVMQDSVDYYYSKTYRSLSFFGKLKSKIKSMIFLFIRR